MSLELLIVAPDDRGLSRSEIDRCLADESLWRRDASNGRTICLSAPPPLVGSDGPFAALAVEVPTPIDTQLANETLLFVEDIARRLGWRVLEPVSGAQIDPSDRRRWVPELVAYADEGDQHLPTDTWLAAALEQPIWWMVLLSVVAFGAAAAIVIISNIPPDRIAVALGALGTILLVALLMASGAWRSRRSRRAKSKSSREPSRKTLV